MDFVSNQFMVSMLDTVSIEKYKCALLRNGVKINPSVDTFNSSYALPIDDKYSPKQIKAIVDEFDGGVGIKFAPVQWDFVSLDTSGYCIYNDDTRKVSLRL